MPEFEVTELLGQNSWTKDGNTVIFWEFKAKGVDKVCTIGRKPDNPLKVGDKFEATSTEDRGKLKLKRVPQGGFGGGGRAPDPARDARITRMASQERAIRYMVAKGVTDFKLDDDFRKVVKWFADDANAAGEAAK